MLAKSLLNCNANLFWLSGNLYDSGNGREMATPTAIDKMNASGSVQRTIMINRTLKSAITCENVFHNTEHKSLKINRTQNVFI